VPVRWPSEWGDAAGLEFLKGTPFNCLIVNGKSTPDGVIEQARRAGLQVRTGQDTPGATIVEGVWPGVRLTAEKSSDAEKNDADSGPTGAPWIDSNGWKVRLARERNPARAVWVNAAPPQQSRVLRFDAYIAAMADAAANGGDWIVSLHPDHSRALAAKEEAALAAWRRILAAAAFFRAHRAWRSYATKANFAVISDFSGKNEFLAGELLNLTARTQQPYRILESIKAGSASMSMLKAAFYADQDPPPPALRKVLEDFVRRGGLLITGPNWGKPDGAAMAGDAHLRYAVYAVGKGRLAIAREPLQDPYIAARDARVLMSHSTDLVRLWNATGFSSCLTEGSGGHTLLQLVRYVTRPGEEPVTVWIAGSYAAVRLVTLEHPAPQPLRAVRRGNGVELHLPALGVYGAIELDRQV
jgi:hypothetical protein